MTRAAVIRGGSTTPPDVADYWERRARRYAGDGEGLRAVCSYGMPQFYNRAIELSQRRALKAWLAVAPGSSVLDVGCGVGRWSRYLASRGAMVTGIDLSPTMVAEATARAIHDGVGGRCHFLIHDVADLDLGRTYQLILSVTVLQHIVEIERKRRALERLRDHLDADGRMVLLEAAPTRRFDGANGRNFVARGFDAYRALFARAGLEVVGSTGVDSPLLKKYVLPLYRRLPRPLALAALAGGTALTLPLDLLLGRWLQGVSWHRVMVLRHQGRETS